MRPAGDLTPPLTAAPAPPRSLYPRSSAEQRDALRAWELTGQAKVVLKVESEATLCVRPAARPRVRGRPAFRCWTAAHPGPARPAPLTPVCSVALRDEARKAGLVAATIRDAGHTQVAAGSVTVLAVGPGPADRVNSVTGRLKLL